MLAICAHFASGTKALIIAKVTIVLVVIVASKIRWIVVLNSSVTLIKKIRTTAIEFLI